jgi:hypothetical protein
MALGFTKSSGGGEDFLPSFRFNAVSGDAEIVGNVKSADGVTWEKQVKEITFPAKFIFDFANLEVGWMHFAATGPSFSMAKIGQPFPAKPSADHKQGFRVKMYSKTHGLSLFSNSSKTIAEVMDVLHDAYLKDEKAHAGKVPVIEIKGTKKVSVKTKEGAKNYKQPEWSIVSWVARPEEMDVKAKEAEAVAEAVADDEF